MGKYDGQIKLIQHNAGGVNRTDDPSYPVKYEAWLNPPDFMRMAFVMLYGGTEHIVIRAMSKEILQEFLVENGMDKHPRMIRFNITDSREEATDVVSKA